VIPITLTIIARDEADRIEAAIRSVPFAVEVVVVESGSSDDTAGVAATCGARVVATDWPGHVAQKNRASALASNDWILSLDADERLSPELAAEIAALLSSPLQAAAFEVPRLSWWEGAPLRHGHWYPDRRVRLYDRRRARWVGDDPHDRLQVDGTVHQLRGDLLHFPYRNLGEHLATIDRYTLRAAEVLQERGVRARWIDVALRPFLHLMSALLLRMGFRDGVRGLMVAGLGAAYVLLKWGRLWMRQRGEAAG
jgi:glycosyltransferase involved in cell wall biosynthesis